MQMEHGGLEIDSDDPLEPLKSSPHPRHGHGSPQQWGLLLRSPLVGILTVRLCGHNTGMAAFGTPSERRRRPRKLDQRLLGRPFAVLAPRGRLAPQSVYTEGLDNVPTEVHSVYIDSREER